MTKPLTRALWLWGSAALLLGCSGARWRDLEVAPTYQGARALALAIRAPRGEAFAPAVDTLERSLLRALGARGVSVVRTTGSPAGAGAATERAAIDVEVDVDAWQEGSRILRWLGLGQGEATMQVRVTSWLADGRAGPRGRALGFVRGGWLGGSALTSAREVGEAVADVVATGKVKQ